MVEKFGLHFGHTPAANERVTDFYRLLRTELPTIIIDPTLNQGVYACTPRPFRTFDMFHEEIHVEQRVRFFFLCSSTANGYTKKGDIITFRWLSFSHDKEVTKQIPKARVTHLLNPFLIVHADHISNHT
jgi:hypothetical protein